MHTGKPATTEEWRDSFCGRQQELQTLVARYEEVAAGKGPRLAVVLGDRGMGKTRLVQELYRTLVRRFDAQHYWPDASLFAGNTLRVAPDLADGPVRAHFESYKLVDRPLPFLWWGFRLSDPDVRNAARNDMAAHRATLDPHLAPLRYARELGATHEHMRQAGIDAASELGKSLLKAAVQAIPGAGVLTTVVDLLLDYAGKGKSAADAVRSRTALRKAHGSENLLQGEASRIDDIHERTVEDLASVLASGRSGRPLPVVVFCDDAQFAREGGDTGAQRFLTTLWERAHLSDWPLLLVLTHWSLDWHHASGLPREASCAGQLFTSARSAHSGLVIDLPKEPGLAALISAGLPGLSRDDEQVLLAKSDGNPQALIELIELVRRSPAWRHAGDGELTDHARREIPRRSTKLSELILDRLSSDVTPETVRQAVALSALQGIEFFRGLTQATAKNLGLGDAEQGMEQALHPHRLVVNVEAGIAGFLQRAYHEAASRLVSGHLGDAHEVEQALLRTAIGLLEDGARWNCLAHNEQIAVWGVVVGLAEPHRDVAMRVRAGTGLIWLIQAALSGHHGADIARAAELAARFEAGLQSRWAVSDFSPSAARLPLHAMRLWSGSARVFDLASEILVHARTLAATQTTAEARRDVSVSLDDVGDAAMARGDLDVAETAFRESLAIRRALALTPDPRAQADLAVALHHLGTVARERGLLASALTTFRECLAIRRELAAKLNTFDAQRDFSEALDDVGSVTSALGNWAEASDVYEQSVVLRRLQATQSPSVQSQSDLSVALSNMGRVARAEGDWTRAELAWRDSLSIARDLAEKLRTPLVQRSFSVSLDNVGVAARARRDWTEAGSLYQESLAIRRDLAARFGTPQAQRDLSVSLYNVACIAREEGLLEDAEAAYRESLAISRELVQRLGTHEVRRDTCVCLYLLAEMLRGQGRLDVSCELLREAQPMLDDLSALLNTAQTTSMASEVRALIAEHCGC